MTNPNRSNYQIKVEVNQHSEVEGIGIDIEPVDVDPVTTDPTYAAAHVNDTDEIEDNGDYNDAATGTSIHRYKRFINMPKKAIVLLAVVASLGIGVIIGLGLSGVIEHKRQQQQQQKFYQENALAGIAREKKKEKEKGKKPGKGKGNFCLNDHDSITDKDENDFCRDIAMFGCGQTFTDENVFLSDDLYCSVNFDFASDEELMALNAAITLTGPDASIDCQGHSIRQRTGVGFASECLDLGWLPVDNPFEPTLGRKQMKVNCLIYYQTGILLVDGAKAVNCHVEDFYEGYYIINGGQVLKSEAIGNRHGVFIQDLTGSIETMVTDVYAHDNYKGIYVLNHPNANTVTVEDVTS